MLQLNRAKFSANGSCGYVLKPQCMCQGKDTAPEPPPCWDLEPLPSFIQFLPGLGEGYNLPRYAENVQCYTFRVLLWPTV